MSQDPNTSSEQSSEALTGQWVPTEEELDIMYGPGAVHHGPFSEVDDEDLEGLDP